jgi:hypothetical protein
MGHLNGCRYLSHDRGGLNWIWTFGNRLFSSAMGHTPTLFSATALAEYMLAGIQYVLGDLDADATPSAKLAAKR